MFFNRFIARSPFSKLKKLLKDQLIPQNKQKLAKLRKDNGNKIIGEVKVDDAVLGMRGLPLMLYDGSALDPQSGITFRGYSIPDFQKNAQKAPGGYEPLPEAMFWLLLTGRMPTDDQVKWLDKQWNHLGKVEDETVGFILSLPAQSHPMTMLSMALLYMQKDSIFFQAYHKGVNKSQYWQYYYEDAIRLVAKLPRICAIIYRHKYKNSTVINSHHKKIDWAGNFSHMLGFESQQMKQCLRGYLSIHSDHQGGNVSAHTSHLVGSALSDPYLSYSAAMNGLAGPLHGLANQQCLKWLVELRQHHKGQQPNVQLIEQFVNKTLSSGRVIPGYGHAVLRNTDPRFMHLRQFAQRNIKSDYIVDLANKCFETIPGILGKLGKVKNPYPNVDAFSGCLLQHYGMYEYDFFTTVFGVSRSLGCLTNGVWSRAFGLPIQRPNSINIDFISKLGQKK